jgi:hypothetical protein
MYSFNFKGKETLRWIMKDSERDLDILFEEYIKDRL